jgi:hypothetical protein
VLPWTTVCGPSEAQAAAAIIREKGDMGNGLGGRRGTSVSYAIDMGSLLLGEFPGNATNKFIDISANGPNNDGLPVEQSRMRAVAKGYTINAIAIPSFMRGIEHDNARYFAENVIGGPGAFVVAPTTTNDYAAAIRRKLVDEISLPIDGSNNATSLNSVQAMRPFPEGSTVSVSVCASMRDNICAAEDRLFARRSGASMRRHHASLGFGDRWWKQPR